MAKVYFHIDMNAFFVNAEILLDPSLKGKPVAVSGTTRRSVVSTASYEARAFGVHSAQPIQEAIKLCPDLVIVSGHYHVSFFHERFDLDKEKAKTNYLPFISPKLISLDAATVISHKVNCLVLEDEELNK